MVCCYISPTRESRIGSNVTKDKPETGERMHVNFTSSGTMFRRVNGVSVPEPPKDNGADVFVFLNGKGGNVTNDLRIMLNPGNRIKLDYGIKYAVEPIIYHVRAIVDGTHVVVRVGEIGQWRYRLMHWDYLEEEHARGRLVFDGTDQE